MSRRCTHTRTYVPAVLPDGSIHDTGLLYEPDCDPDRCWMDLVFTVDYLAAWDDWAELQPWEVLRETLCTAPDENMPEEFVA